MADTAAYLRVILVGMLFTFAYNYLAATLRAIGNTKAALYFLLASLGYNLLAAWGAGWPRLGAGHRGHRPGHLQRPAALRPFVPCLHAQKALLPAHPKGRHASGAYAHAADHQLCAVAAPPAVQPVPGQADDSKRGQRHQHRRHLRLHRHHPSGKLLPAFGISACEAIAIFVAQNQGAKQYQRANRGFLQALPSPPPSAWASLCCWVSSPPPWWPCFWATTLRASPWAYPTSSLWPGSTSCPSSATPTWATIGALAA